jgi:hypothetical protein
MLLEITVGSASLWRFEKCLDINSSLIFFQVAVASLASHFTSTLTSLSLLVTNCRLFFPHHVSTATGGLLLIAIFQKKVEVSSMMYID